MCYKATRESTSRPDQINSFVVVVVVVVVDDDDGGYRACKLFNILLYATLCLTTSGDIVVCFHTAVCLSC